MSDDDQAGDWALGSLDQTDFERDLISRASEQLAQQENELDDKRLQKTLKKLDQVNKHVAILEERIDNRATLISQKAKAKADLVELRAGQLAQLLQDERDIRARMQTRTWHPTHGANGTTTTAEREPDESEHDYLVRTGKITPFDKGGLSASNSLDPGLTYGDVDDGDAENIEGLDDHRVLQKPESFDIDEPDSTRSRDDGVLRDYRARVARWEAQQSESKPSVTKDFVIDAEAGFKVPGDLWKRLFGYQKTGVRWLWELYSQKVGGIIGDEMGLGKTVQVAVFFASLNYSNLLTKPALVVCPATVLDQWLTELHQWWPPLRVAILHSIGTAMGGKNRESDAESSDDSDEDDAEQVAESANMSAARNLVDSIFKTGHVLITTYAGVKIYERLLVKRTWAYACLDEGHKIRNPDSEVSLACKQIKTPYRLILSGTPIQNNLVELWSLFDFVFPGRLGTLPVFLNQFSVPINVGGYANASNIQVQTAYKCAVVLRDMIAPYMLRRMKSDVASDLPAKTEKVLFCKLTRPQKQAYLQFLKSEELISIMKGKRQVLYGVDILRKICNHPDLVLHNVRDPNYGDPNKSGKMLVTRALLELWKTQGHRALLFSQTRQMLDILESFVRDLGLIYTRMDGTTPISRRQQLVDAFNKDVSYQVFLLTTKVGGLGVNLTGADRVIIFDPDWNPSTDVQARERAWRLGQKKEVMIYRLMIAGSIEEKIYHRQIFKQFLTNKILKDPKQKRFFKNTDLHDLFSLGDGSESATLFGSEQTADSGTGGEESSAKRRKMEKPLQDDLSSLTGVSKESDFLNGQNGTPENRSDGKEGPNNESGILESIFAKAGVQSTLEHDAIVNSSRPETVLMEREAERVATQAANALRESRKETRKAKIGTPTWTGRSGLAGRIKKKNAEGNSVESSKSSSSILERLRRKRELETKVSDPSLLGTSDLDKHANLMGRIQEYLETQPERRAKSADVVRACKIPLDGPQDVANLRQILRKVAVWDGRAWTAINSN